MTERRSLPVPGPAGRRRAVNYDEDLNDEQRAAVHHGGGPMLILAGAGTGKTRTLVYRVCRLIEDGVSPNRLLLLTFTNKAAREMLDRVRALLGDLPSRVAGGTFHSAGHRILRQHAALVGYTPRFSIVDREDATDLMAAALAAVSPDQPDRRPPRAKLLIDLYSHVINTGRPLDEVLADRAPQFLDQHRLIAETFRAYLERKRAADVMDFDDLLLNWLILLRQQPEARTQLAARFDHILVDEYQDTNRLQADILEAMLSPDRNLCVVGDDAQAIYGFRGADFANILGFPERHPDCTVFRLETNYRSSPEILDLANASIAHNTQGFPKRLRAVCPSAAKPRDVTVATPERQASWVADEVLRLHEEGSGLEDMAVLYRNHAHSLDLQVELTRRNIPYRVRSGLRFFEQRHVKDALAHLRFVDNPRDEVSFQRMVKLRRGFGPKLALRLWNGLSGADPLHALVDGGALPDLPSGTRRSVAELRELLGELRSEAMRNHAGEAIRRVVERFYRDYARQALENAGSRLEDLEQLAVFADGYPDVNTFLAEVTLLNDLSGEDAVGGFEDEALTLSTAHQAKGLEWDVVFLIWVSEGRLPSPRCDDEEEERRLFYVAVTRARTVLALVHPAVARDRYRVDVLVEPSRFLLELPRELLEVVVDRQSPADDALEPLPEPRYELPGFLDPQNEDPVN